MYLKNSENRSAVNDHGINANGLFCSRMEAKEKIKRNRANNNRLSQKTDSKTYIEMDFYPDERYRSKNRGRIKSGNSSCKILMKRRKR